MASSGGHRARSLWLAGGERLAWLTAVGSFTMARIARNDYAAREFSSPDTTEGWYISAGIAVAVALGIKAVGAVWALAED